MNYNFCVTCHNKHSHFQLNRLKQIEQFIKINDIEPYTGRYHYFLWNVNERCEYGMTCSNLQSLKNQTNNLVRYLEPYLITIALSDNKEQLKELLYYLKGYFPSVHQTLERIHYTKNMF